MRFKKLLIYGLVVAFLFFKCDCGASSGPPNGYGERTSSIYVQDTVWVDKRAMLDGLNRIKITLDLPSRKNTSVIWSYIDPDDPADDMDNVDVNGPAGNDNGYLGIGEDYLPALRSKFYKNGQEDSVSTTDENGHSEIFFEVAPDTYGWWHPGDNFVIKAQVGDTTLYSDTIYSWKRLKVEFDWMESGNIEDSVFKLVSNIFSGRCLENTMEDLNKKAYMYINPYDTVFLIRQDTLPDQVIIDSSQVESLIQQHRDTLGLAHDYKYPIYIIGGTTDSLGWFGVTCIKWYIDDDSILRRRPEGIIIFVQKIIEYVSPSQDYARKMLAIVIAHELGHYIAGIKHDDPHTCDKCIMRGFNPNSLWDCEYQHFCTFCTYMFRAGFWRSFEEPVLKSSSQLAGRER